MSRSAGIASIGIALPSLSLPLEELASLRGVDPDKYRVGLGCRNMALCAAGEDVVSLGVEAATCALASWGEDLGEIGLIAVGTETARDMSRPLSAWIAGELQLREDVRSYEVKHACYGGTLAIRQALEWIWSGANRGRSALVVCSDIALYGPGHPGEPTQGAAAVALVIGEPRIAAIDVASYAFSRPAFDFWRPVGEAYPSVDGPLSLRCYKDAVSTTFSAWRADEDSPFEFEETNAFAFHTPFPRMVQKGFVHGAISLGVSEDDANRRFIRSVEPNLRWNREVGNCYTSSTWLGLTSALVSPENRNLAAFSYGSGCGAELVLLRRADAADLSVVEARFENYLQDRVLLDGATYETMRATERRAGRQQAAE